MRHLIAAAAIATMSAGSASGAALFAFVDTGDDVVGTLSGTLDLPTNPRGIFLGSNGGRINPSRGILSINADLLDAYSISGPVSFGSGGSTSGSGTGGAIFLGGDRGTLGLASTYDGGELNATLTFSGESLASLGVDSDSDPYVYTLDGTGDTLTVTFRQTAVIPLPAGLPLLMGGLGLLAMLRRR